MASAKRYRVDFQRDDEVDVWIATSKDVPGLVLESSSLDKLMERVSSAIPELLEMDNRPVVHRFAQEYM